MMNTVLTKQKVGLDATAYGRIPMHCGNGRGVHEFALKVAKKGKFTMIFGIDEGRTSVNSDWTESSTNHYGLTDTGLLYKKGGKSMRCGKQFKEKDIVKMRVDLGRKSLSFA